MCASPIPADLRQFSLRVSIRFLFELILTFVGGPREARVPSFARMRSAHHLRFARLTALRAVLKLGRIALTLRVSCRFALGCFLAFVDGHKAQGSGRKAQDSRLRASGPRLRA